MAVKLCEGNRETYERQVRDVLKVGEICMKGKRETCER